MTINNNKNEEPIFLPPRKQSLLKVKKIDAACQQLVTAITLFMKDGDPVSIHTLGAAAQEIFESLGKHKGVKSMRLYMKDMVREERKKDFVDRLNKEKNFFKHGGSDPNEVVELDPELTELILWDAVMQHHYVTGEKNPVFVVFNLWMYAQYPELFALTPEQDQIYQALTSGFDPENRKSFLDMISVFKNAK